MEKRTDLAVIDGGNECSEEGAEAESYGISESDAEVTDSKAEGNTTHAPKDSEEECILQVAWIAGVSCAEQAVCAGNEDACQKRWGDDPGGETLNGPVDFPGPALNSPEWDEVSGGTEAADPVEDDAKKWIRSQGASRFRKSCGIA